MRTTFSAALLASLTFLAACGDSGATTDTTGSGGATTGSGGSGGAATGSGGSGGATTGSGGAAPVCGGLESSVISSKDFPADCGGLDEADSYACAEKRFWLVLREDYAERGAVFDVLG